MNISEWQKEVHRLAVEKGWYIVDRTFPELIALLHSEVSEAFDAYRNLKDIKEELANIALRLLDTCEYWGVNLEAEMIKKHNYNKTRPYRHGNKVY